MDQTLILQELENQNLVVGAEINAMGDQLEVSSSGKLETCYQPLKEDLYQNYTMVGPDGTILCRCGKKKVDWYMARDLATVICKEPFTIQLKFQPGGNGEKGDSYQLADKNNHCVVFGRDNYNTKHHVVEYEYRQHMPLAYKSHNSYDILILCGPCHTRYEIEAMGVKSQLALKYDAPLNGKGWYYDKGIGSIKKAATALLRSKEKIPAFRIAELTKTVEDYLHKASGTVTAEDLQTLSDIDPVIRTSDYQTHGEAVVNALKAEEELTAFIQMWRKHFLDIMQPQYIHPFWGVQRDRAEVGTAKSVQQRFSRRYAQLNNFEGKSTLILALSEAPLDTSTLVTPVVDISSFILHAGNILNESWTISLWDTCTHEEYERLRSLSYSGQHCFVIVFAVNDRPSFESITSKWIPELSHHRFGAPIVLVGAKIETRGEFDENDRESAGCCCKSGPSSSISLNNLFVSDEEALDLVKNTPELSSYVPVSALQSLNLSRLRSEILKQVIQVSTATFPASRNK